MKRLKPLLPYIVLFGGYTGLVYLLFTVLGCGCLEREARYQQCLTRCKGVCAQCSTCEKRPYECHRCVDDCREVVNGIS